MVRVAVPQPAVEVAPAVPVVAPDDDRPLKFLDFGLREFSLTAVKLS